jgi:hypothetical protein
MEPACDSGLEVYWNPDGDSEGALLSLVALGLSILEMAAILGECELEVTE